MLKKIVLSLLVFLGMAFSAVSQENIHFSKECTLSVMVKSFDASIDFSAEEEEQDTLSVTVHAFSYSDKKMGDFTFTAEKQKDGTYSAKKQTVQSERNGKTIEVTVSSAKIDLNSRSVKIKFKPGAMPFNITLKSKD